MKYLRLYDTRSDYEAEFQQSPFVGLIKDEGTLLYNADINSPAKLPLYVTALEDLTVLFSTNAIEYSLDNATWNALPVDTATPTIEAGNKVYFRASGLTATSTAGIGTFTISGLCEVGGNIMSMIYGADYMDKVTISTNYVFYKLFYNAKKIKSAFHLVLPATTLADNCYRSMFYGCSSLVNAPELPATTLAVGCYDGMFYYCSSLVNAPELPATTLAKSCYDGMFEGCTQLNYIKAMFTTAPSTSYTQNWVTGVAASGTFVKNAAATWTDTFDVSAIPTGWTVELAES